MINTPMPTALKIGFKDYTVIDWPVLEAFEKQRHGECDAEASTIRVCRRFGDRKAAQTLIHEIFHALFDMWKVDDQSGEEWIVTRLSMGLATVWRDNPAAFAWISENLVAP